MAYQENTKPYVPLTCHGHSRPVPHLNFSGFVGGEDEFYMISACKDNNPMLRDGLTGDWIGTFFGHKGAVFQARLSPDAATAATASADYTAKIWDTHSGETIYTLEHPSVVRCVAFPPDHSTLVATGGVDKVFRIFDLSRIPAANGASRPDSVNGVTVQSQAAIEIGAGTHKGIIRSIVWTSNPNILVTAADDKTIRWWDLRTNTIVQELPVAGEIGTCEFTNIKPRPGNIGDGYPVLCIAAGKTVYFYGGADARSLIKSVTLPYEAASVALHPGQRKFVVGGKQDTWVKVYNYDSEQELDVHKGHHGPIWSISFSPDGKLYATGSEDGTIKMWKNCAGAYGLWRSNE